MRIANVDGRLSLITEAGAVDVERAGTSAGAGFGVGLNYRDHAGEAGLALPDSPIVFTKFASSLTGPYGEIELTAPTVDWEAELVAVIGRRAWQAPTGQGWAHVAGLTAWQDLSGRVLQQSGPAPQFNLGKSRPGSGPMGPWLVSTDEFADPDDLTLECTLNGESMQKSRTS